MNSGFLQTLFSNLMMNISGMKDVQTLPGADIDSDHNLLVAKIHSFIHLFAFLQSIQGWSTYRIWNKSYV